MNRILIASALGLTLFAAPAFADCAVDFSLVQGALNDAKLDDAAMAKAKDLIDKTNAAITAKDDKACADNVAELQKMAGPAK